MFIFFFQAEDGIRDYKVTGVQTCALPISAVKAHGFKPENVKINVTLLGGGFGRRAENDYAVDVGFLAKAVPGYPVKLDRKSTRLNSSHLVISYAVFCLKKK